MRKYQDLLKPYLQEILDTHRHQCDLTQEKMADLLHMSVRSYCDLEHGRSGFSAVSLILFLAQLPEDKLLETVKDFRRLVEKLESEEAA
ncbi:helix-turn-helix transcriptional regulator [Acutalibacter caecimuris]|uniref:helix-turn-helix transcriptional regulator n=1 Tax=Acutalibacter caecimuris TaxID=3093657 RepID=UPI002AC8D2A6|nr:helix-turn-helix transcriptional regulator [Acutalibacter sp. M00118]